MVFSWHQVMNTAIGDKILIFIDKNSEPLTRDVGFIALISAADHFTCGRHIKGLEHIELRHID